MTTQKKRQRGRPASDGAVDMVRVNISLTDWHHQQLKKLAGPHGASAWIRNAIEKASK